MTLSKRRELDQALHSECSNIFRSYPVRKPKTPTDSTRTVTPPTFDTKEAVKAMQLDSLLTNNPMLNGQGVKIGELR